MMGLRRAAVVRLVIGRGGILGLSHTTRHDNKAQDNQALAHLENGSNRTLKIQIGQILSGFLGSQEYGLP
jgi:hypothetical protein